MVGFEPTISADSIAGTRNQGKSWKTMGNDGKRWESLETLGISEKPGI